MKNIAFPKRIFRPWWQGLLFNGDDNDVFVTAIMVDQDTGEALQDEDGSVWTQRIKVNNNG